MPRRSTEIRDVVDEFVARLAALIEDDARVRFQEAILASVGGRDAGGSRGRGNGLGGLGLVGAGGRKRRKGPIQLCPVPGCHNRAAPVFGMVCAKHKDLPKSEIKKYREARRAQKLKGKGGGAGRGRRGRRRKK